ncbi:MAG TPA: cadmium-translocating P-type ATPase [Candidatus Onthenecus intestinigallinarum]|uniref:Cd(2+)-exporting ATPase n=1 Tax=Candidatus Onthenecus intestinigallinarum TaxID=2840875 RepID=A0A9D0ZAI6_9FIRM|nr:cadmium-translocating P-type ATPase [Candidatus Onthenecus intestinigallinarum]
MTPKQRRLLARILAGGALFLLAQLAPLAGLSRAALFLVPYALAGWDVLYRAVRNIRSGEIFDENFLMAVATIGAFALGEYAEAVAVMLFYQVGELFQGYAVGRSRRSIAALMDIRPDYANVERGDGLEQVDPEQVGVGDVIVVKPGERVPLDGTVLEGASTLDTSALTGESLPRDVACGDEIISGCVNLSGALRVRVTHPFGETTVARILDLVENASSRKARAENFITKFARYYTPAVVGGAAALFVLPSLAFGNWTEWFRRALTFLVISCPCALVISVPLSFFGGIGGASKRGILVKGSNYLETLAEAGIVVFDKTGTLTRGSFDVTAIHPNEVPPEDLLEMAALAELLSDHPISRSLKAACRRDLDRGRVRDVTEIAGEGVQARVDGRLISAGNGKLMDRVGAPWHDCHRTGTIVHVAADGRYMGHVVISDTVKPDAQQAVRTLKEAGVRKTVMLTGDSARVGEAVGTQLGLDEVRAQLLPAQKLEQIERLLGERKGREKLVFVGDGINDAPALSRADIGIAMGAMGSAAAIEAADIVLMDDQPSKVATAIRIARRTLRIVRQNIVFALGVKAVVLLLGAMGLANMWAAVFADVGVSVIAILNAMRALRTRNL